MGIALLVLAMDAPFIAILAWANWRADWAMTSAARRYRVIHLTQLGSDRSSPPPF